MVGRYLPAALLTKISVWWRLSERMDQDAQTMYIAAFARLNFTVWKAADDWHEL